MISKLNKSNSAKCLCVQEDAACIWKHFPTRALMPGITNIGQENAAVLPPTCDTSCDWQCILESFLRLGRGWKFVQISRSCHFLWHSYILLRNTIEAKARNGKVSWLSAWNIVVQTKWFTKHVWRFLRWNLFWGNVAKELSTLWVLAAWLKSWPGILVCSCWAKNGVYRQK